MRYSVESKRAVLSKLSQTYSGTFAEIPAPEANSQGIPLSNWRKQARKRSDLYPNIGAGAQGCSARDNSAVVVEIIPIARRPASTIS